MVTRIIVLLAGSSLLTYTTSPIALTDAIERLLSPLKKLHVPVHTFAMMMTISLRFIPTLLEETDKIMTAQKARGASFSEGNLVQRAKHWCRFWFRCWFPLFTVQKSLQRQWSAGAIVARQGVPRCASSMWRAGTISQ